VRLGRYEVVRELGKGAMGIVYLAKDPLIGRLVALKTIRPASHVDDDESREFQQRFMREAQAAGILNHPNIVTVHDIGQDQESGMSFIAMEYVEGQNLKDVMAQGRALSFEEIGEIVAQVADAIDFAHAKGIVHRDVKPANIILIEGNRAKITDFGIAKIASGGGNLTSTGQFLGTPNYMAPEQIKGSPVDGRTDIFSLGIVFYETLTRRKPFGGDSLTTISYRIVHEAFQPLHEINPRIPDGFEEITAKALAKDPARRYQRAREMANEIRAVARGERPQRIAEPVLADETVITRNADQVPTLEIPFPEAAAMADAAESRRSRSDRHAKPPMGSFWRRVRPPRRVRNTFNEVDGNGIWSRPLPATLVFSILGIALLSFLLVAGSLARQRATVRPVDTRAESLRNQQRRIRTEANRLLTSGNVDGAYQKFQDLNRIAPASPFVAAMLQQLGAIKLQEVSVKERLTQSKEKFTQGMTLYNNGLYAESAALFQEAFQLDPTSNETARYLKRAQDQQQRQAGAQARSRTAVDAQNAAVGGIFPATGSAMTTRSGAADGVRNRGTVSLTVSFDSPVNDGYIQVRSGGQVLFHVNLWEERRRAIFRYRAARAINETREVRAHSDLEIWIIVPSLQISWNRKLDLNYAPGSAHKLTITLDRATHQISYQTN
jgi:serine/threonine protein kinase